MSHTSHVVAIGASTGGVDALLTLAAALPEQFPAIVFVTQHIGANHSVLPELMRARGPNAAVHPGDGETPRPGTIYIAPPDRHMLVEDGVIRLISGPRENHCRPAIDPMFRSVAVGFRSCAIGVVLSGFLDDGAAGLAAIKASGGTAIVQDPATAFEPSMPRAALAATDVDHVLPIGDIVPVLGRLVGLEPRVGTVAANPPETVRIEQQLLQEDHPMEDLKEIATPSSLTCPDCGGSLWELKDGRPLRYRCHTGHAFSAGTLEHSQQVTAEMALRSGVRALRERAMLLRRVAHMSRGHGQVSQARSGEDQAQHLDAQADALVRLIEERGGGA